ncbi:isocitrate lyase/PEP mutase family protein [Roseomonas sp. NAR14]|uniref:Isocitrate lyase/PEP mutase family protein n=1 Tax=Roseomonas acroporae TaxID=2937791 RepID=A0A9X1Y3X0_9PROT|nr:isocitrate lyase/PEP mutase family protein [Roseomonas acroporae]MCK8783724.1 isocitrate lyase/PEP mutase family protein [Roseomonas acroporae]
MDWTDRRRRFRAILAGDRCVHPGSVYDPISARIAEDLGFELGMFAGSTGSLAVLGAPDLVVLTLTEFAQQALRINRAGGLPLLVDADHGYGNALSVMRTVQELETAGVAGMTIEDTALPQPYGAGQPRLLSVEEGLGKMRAAVAARQDPNLVILARSSAVTIAGTEEAVARAKAYAVTGVDGFFLPGVTRRAEVEPIAAAIDLPLVIASATGELADQDWLRANRVRVGLQGHQPFQAAVQAVYATLKALREGTAPKDLQNLAPPALMRQVTRESDYQGWTRDFLGG